MQCVGCLAAPHVGAQQHAALFLAQCVVAYCSPYLPKLAVTLLIISMTAGLLMWLCTQTASGRQVGRQAGRQAGRRAGIDAGYARHSTQVDVP